MQALQRHPAEKSFGVQNDHMLNGLATARRCVQRLIAGGFTVLSVRVGHREPTILVQHDARCEQLRGTLASVADGARDRCQIATASLDGCSVQWVVKH